jgi:hypothetical protein
LATRLTRRPEALQWSKTNSCKRFAVWLKRSPDTTMLKLTAPVLRSHVPSAAADWAVVRSVAAGTTHWRTSAFLGLRRRAFRGIVAAVAE